MNESINLHVTATCYHVIAIYRHLLFFIILASTATTRATVHLRPARRPYGSLTASLKHRSEGRIVHLWSVGRLHGPSTIYWKTVRFTYGLPEGHTVHLRPVGRLHGSPTVCRKTVRFIHGPSEGRTVYLRSVGRLYGSSTARWKAVRFIVRLILRTVSRTYG